MGAPGCRMPVRDEVAPSEVAIVWGGRGRREAIEPFQTTEGCLYFLAVAAAVQ